MTGSGWARLAVGSQVPAPGDPEGIQAVPVASPVPVRTLTGRLPGEPSGKTALGSHPLSGPQTRCFTVTKRSIIRVKEPDQAGRLACVVSAAPTSRTVPGTQQVLNYCCRLDSSLCGLTLPASPTHQPGLTRVAVRADGPALSQDTHFQDEKTLDGPFGLQMGQHPHRPGPLRREPPPLSSPPSGPLD